MIIKAVD